MHLSNKPAMGKKSTHTETVPDDDDSDDEKHEKPKPKLKKSKTEPATLALSDKPANTGKKGKAAKVKKLSVKKKRRKIGVHGLVFGRLLDCSRLITTFRVPASCLSSGSELRKELVSAEGIRQDAPDCLDAGVKDIYTW